MHVLQALQKYKQIHADFPANVECLRYLMHICHEHGKSAVHCSLQNAVWVIVPCCCTWEVHATKTFLTANLYEGDAVICSPIQLFRSPASSVCHLHRTADLPAQPVMQNHAEYFLTVCFCSCFPGLQQEESEYATQLRKAERSQQSSRVSNFILMLLYAKLILPDMSGACHISSGTQCPCPVIVLLESICCSCLAKCQPASVLLPCDC